MIDLYIGLPGCGKTSLLTAFACEYIRKGIKVYSNVPLGLHSDLFVYVRNEWIGLYDISGGVLLLDEGEIFAEARSYKTFPKHLSDWIMLHRHYGIEIKIFAQRYKGVDVKIRNLCEHVYMVRRGLLGLTSYTPIDYRIIIPDAGDRAGDIVEGYQMKGFFGRLFSTRYIIRRKYYKYFDSWSAPVLPPLPLEE